ncbi:L-fuculose-phosphate aldolase [Litorivivens lipolytica]|uniref:L-fuculose-phosphate aldolase n=1 Tax=Litorivivens lipolytica TaxID=1524264 RepID=A0A7W4W3V1_9GAMM|nr:class II aldolase/adducin family protein [Litorivivens lipolytica]MBB3046960.1 L-fuculose-phosphate aldolase [Litorivivens lipolytica]
MSKQRFSAARRELCETLHALADARLSPGSTGNASVRVDGGLLISPTGAVCSQIQPADVVFIDSEGAPEAGALKPSSEWHMHFALYCERPEIGGIVHCHSRYATTLACLRKSIPAYHYMIAMAGGDSIRLADYATFGTEALAEAVVNALKDRKACLMANHGQIALGATSEQALALAIQVEDLAAGYYQCLTLGEPSLLTREEMAEVLEKFSGYGQQPGQHT